MRSSKNSFYRSDGSGTPQIFSNPLGRDYYIAYNSGGVWNNAKPIRANKAVNWATCVPNYISGKNNISPIPKFTHYYGNGTGRDCYIM